ncbi:hypothetical protein [Tardiphaga sp.]|jgi:hypothetical protein|uniref:hypothetical protein n=1 Tax=Tardiphaga sp. TaxID=1926292 RepID=UPI0037DA3C87
MTVFPTQDSFVRGEISPRLHARASLDLYRSALAKCENFITLPHGGLRKRGGSYFAGESKGSNSERPIPFIFSETQAYMLWFGEKYFRVYAYGGPVMNGLSVVEVATPYTYADVVDLQFDQSGDVLYLTHQNYAPRKITRSTNTSWSISPVNNNDGPFGFQNANETVKMYASATSGTVTLTADSAVFTSDMVGQLVKIQVETFGTWKPWEAGGYLNSSSGNGFFRRHNGNVYVSTAPGLVTGKVQMGGTPPTHLKGEEWDGGSELAEQFDGSTTDYGVNYGVKWRYVHSGYGIARVLSVGGGGLTATADVLETFPAELIGAGNKSYRWSTGGFGGSEGYPRSVTIFEERLCYGQKYSVYGSKTFDFNSFRSGANDDDAVSFKLAGANDITWLQESDGFLLVGTIAGVRTLSGGGNNEPLTPSKFKNRGSPTKRCSSIPPVKAGSTFVYVGFDRKSVVEMAFSLEKNGYSTTPVSIISEHIPKQGISSICYQSETDPIFWLGLDNGELGGLTYEADQNVRGWHRHKIGGRWGNYDHGVIEWVASTPGQSGADDVWILVRRTINGFTRRYIEVLRSPFEYGDVTDAFMVDCGLTYEGVPKANFSGLSHLEGEPVVALADGKVVKGLVVHAGEVVLPWPASKIHIGLPYSAVAETLELDVGGRDGSVMGRRKRVNSLILSVLESANIYVKSATRSTFEGQKAGRNTIVPPTNVVSLFTGNLDEVRLDDSWEGQGRIRIEAPDPVPATIRAIIPGFDSEGS